MKFSWSSPHTEPFAFLTPLSPPPPPLLLCLPLSGQRQQPQTEHSGGPLGDPSARVFEVFLIVLNGVQGETLWGGESRARATTLMSESRRQGKRQSSGQLASSDA